MWTQLALALGERLHPVKAAALLRRIDRGWQAEGLCATQVDPDVFFPVPSQELEQVAALLPICLACPVRRSCVASALLGAEAGIWGGTLEDTRNQAVDRLNAGARVDAVLDDLLTVTDETMAGAATSSIDPRSGLGQGSVQVSGVVARIAAVHVRRVTLIWRALPRTPQGRERLKKGMLCW